MGDSVRLADRVFQLEAYNWNDEFNNTVDQIIESLNLPVASEETKLIAKLYLSANLFKDGTNIGMKLYNLGYYKSSDQDHCLKGTADNHKLVLLTACNLILPYISKRYRTVENLLNQSYIGRLKLQWLTIDNISTAVKILGTVNFLLFLRNGKYLTLQERLLRLVPGMSPKDYITNLSMNQVQMELINRDTLWKALAEFLTAILPHINSIKIKNQFMKLSGLIPSILTETKLSDKTSNNEQSGRCVYCNNQPFNPYIIGCKHVFCYFCLHSRYLSDPSAGYSCPACHYKTVNHNEVQRYKIYDHA